MQGRLGECVVLSLVGPELKAGAEMKHWQSLKRPDPQGQCPWVVVSGIIAAESGHLPASVTSGVSLAAWAGR